MVRKQYTPKQGDIVFVNFSPQKGHEQKGRRPALVVSSNVFSEKTGFVLVCPVTTKNNKFPLHISLPEDITTDGFILTEHIRSIDFEAKKVSFIERVPNNFLDEILDILESFYRQ